ncbi:cation diffusion facilitator family transporter [Enterococcus saccharolyticus subsp. saccharolyticus ATCC 43076]|uniref:Cation diffusion facilitator family transporter n=1 Tax=Enterococcus saccharolyticus subsp. saccharolyticus ATCC 43076 TaxID=1139996 RepID=S0NHY8_9ENTE|nr:cation diffusion facilitator family transporter [Enterococcus saccharolyticus subsp. saccharolyticus ATCC 43076]EOT81117.1 cation diffusion facilitator family transporter [Enterococcus saccharolyticus subsp. saccharolyticus ATCC 43076]OJG88555.1 cation diffusion facilitator family transporter [Enterococcus saccharolyticus]
MLNFLLKKIEKENKETQRTKVGQLAGVLGLLSNLILFIGKFLIGFTAGSVSIMADAMNSLSDTISSVLTLIGFKVAAKPADSEHPYGHERFEYISGLFISLIITFVGFQFLQTSFAKILHPEPVKLSAALFLVLIASIGIKVWQGRMYLSFANKIDSQTLKATSKDSLNDVYTTIAVLISAFFEWLTNLRIDGYVGFLLALYILYSGYTMVKDFIHELLGSRPTDKEIQAMEKKLASYGSILGYHDLLVHDYGPQKRFASVHIEVDAGLTLTKAHYIIDEIEKDFREAIDVELVCHLDPVNIRDANYIAIFHRMRSMVLQIDKELRMHDFRVKSEQTLQFDLVIPDDFHLTDKELLNLLQQAVNEKIGAYELDVTLDHNYLL